MFWPTRSSIPRIIGFIFLQMSLWIYVYQLCKPIVFPSDYSYVFSLLKPFEFRMSICWKRELRSLRNMLVFEMDEISVPEAHIASAARLTIPLEQPVVQPVVKVCALVASALTDWSCCRQVRAAPQPRISTNYRWIWGSRNFSTWRCHEFECGVEL